MSENDLMHLYARSALCLLLSCLYGPLVAATLPEFTVLVEANRNTVVNISTLPKAGADDAATGHAKPRDIPSLPDDQRLGDLLRRYFGDAQGEDGPLGIPGNSLGSGFIVSDDGYILTNHHVVADAAEIFVKLADRRELRARLIGSDERSDVALLKVEATHLPTAKIGSTAPLKVGEWVLAIGSPFGFEYSVTAGIVSAKGRSLPDENYIPFLQTDVAINPGNSGGPLYNMNGEVVGINSQIYSRTGGFMGLSFAIPIELAMDVVEQLKTSGKVARGWLGVMVQEITQDLAESFAMDRPRGALISQVVPGSPAAVAGFRAGDILVTFNHNELDTSAALPPIVGRTPLLKPVPAELMRNGKSISVNVTLSQLPEDDANTGGDPKKIAGVHVAKHENALNIGVGPISAERRAALQMTAADPGVMVTDVFEGVAADIGLRVGDVLIQLGGEAITSPGDFYKQLERWSKSKPIALLVQTEDGPQFIAIPLKN